jgi:hypothetical protein
VITQAQRWGQQQALVAFGLLKRAWYDPWQIDAARRHYPQFFAGGATDEIAMANLQQAMHARALAPQEAAAAHITAPRTLGSPTHSWMAGETTPINSAKADFLRRLEGSALEPPPAPLASLRPTAGPAEAPHTPPFREGAFMKNVGTNVTPAGITEMAGRPVFQEAAQGATGAVSRKAIERAARLARRIA